MVVRAAVKIMDLRQNKEIILPVMRHCDAFRILHDLGYSRNEFKELGQGFLDEHDNYLTRVEAKREAIACFQVTETPFKELYSEDLW